jgi:AcrR family transcriptional regulator
VFAERGLEAGVEEIARVAGVGIGTLYRRFPTKDALICALVHDAMCTFIGLARDSADCPDGTGLENFLAAASAYQAEHLGILRRLWNVSSEHNSVAEIRRLVDALLADAKKNGRVRADLTSTDLAIVLWSIRGVIETTGDIAPGAWLRHLDILIAGLRPAAEPLAHPPLSQHEVDQVIDETANAR